MYHYWHSGANPRLRADAQTSRPQDVVLKSRRAGTVSGQLPLVIVNPAAGGGSGGRDWAHAVASVRSNFGPFECAFTKTSGDAARIAETQSQAGRALIIAFGGDGTISEIAAGILRSGLDVELGVLPHGTGQDFVRSLALPSRLADAARSLRDGRSVRIDMGKVCCRGPDGGRSSQYFINSASFGLSGEVTENINRSSKALGGLFAFASQTVRTAFTYDPPDVYLEIDDEPARRLPITTVAFNNGRYFGGGMKMAPDASLVDGRLDMIVVRKLSLPRILLQGPRLYAGAHLGMPEVDHRLVVSARARPVDPNIQIALEVDGESPGFLPADVEVMPKALRVRVPKN